MKRRRRLAIWLMALAAGASSASAQAPKLIKEDVVRLLRIAAMAEWVTAECDRRHIAELSGMLLMTSSATLRAADAADVARFRTAVRQNAERFATKDEACRSATDYLKSVQ